MSSGNNDNTDESDSSRSAPRQEEHPPKRERISHESETTSKADNNDIKQDASLHAPIVSEVKGLSEEELQKVRNCESVCGDEEFMWEMIDATQKSVSEKFNSIESSFSRRKFESISRLCHTIKGSAKMLMLEELATAAENGEKLFKADEAALDEESSEEAIVKLKLAVERLMGTKR